MDVEYIPLSFQPWFTIKQNFTYPVHHAIHIWSRIILPHKNTRCIYKYRHEYNSIQKTLEESSLEFSMPQSYDNTISIQKKSNKSTLDTRLIFFFQKEHYQNHKSLWTKINQKDGRGLVYRIIFVYYVCVCGLVFPILRHYLHLLLLVLRYPTRSVVWQNHIE